MDTSQYELQTERLFLRPVRLSDLDVVWPHTSDPDIPRFMCWNVHEKIATTENFLRNSEQGLKKGTMINWGIFQNQIFCGVIGLEILEKNYDIRFERAELGYWLGKEFWGQGIVIEAAKAVIAFAFQNLKINKIVTGHFVENTRSERVIEKSGFRFIGEQKEHFLKNGQWYDQKIYELLKSDFRSSE